MTNSAPDFDFFEDRYPKRTRKPVNKTHVSAFVEENDEEVLFQKQKLMSHCVYHIEEIVSSSEFNHTGIVKKMTSEEFTMDYIFRCGISTPLLFEEAPEKLGMTLPDAETFTVYDVLDLVGKDRKIEVVEVNEQKGRSMKLVDFIKYYTSGAEFRTELLNVLSLEFSLTNLAKMVKPPSFVEKIDWIDNVWPRELYERQLVHMKTNEISDFATYPKVQRYCLMSVAQCFTDFHIDFGGTSVWYHILKGRKIFWLVEPTEENLLLYEEWIMGGNNSESFFGRIVNKCTRVELHPGMTFIIPSGWIHCVYTPDDSLVFGGNFLHSYSIPMQLRVVRSEDRIRVGSKYRFPHFKQMIWYVIENIVRNSTGRRYLKPINIKAYLAQQQKDSAMALSYIEEDNDSLDEQEPVCRSVVETGCKKSGIIKGIYNLQGDTMETVVEFIWPNHMSFERAQKVVNFLNGMGMEESESDSEELNEQIHKTVPAIEEEEEEESYDENVFYDNIGNGADGCYMLIPTQIKYGDKNLEEFSPVLQYNEDYLKSRSNLELNGYFTLFEYGKKLLKTKRPEVGEGITRPRHLLLEFEQLLNYVVKQDRLKIELDVDIGNSSQNSYSCEEYAEKCFPILQEETISLTLPESKKQKSHKRAPAIKKEKEEVKKAGKRSKQNAPSTGAPILVDGLPLPLQEAGSVPAPNPYGYNPMEEIVELGHKPLPSAFRRGANMAKAPAPQRFKLKKMEEKKVEPETTDGKISEEIVSAEMLHINVDSNLEKNSPERKPKKSNISLKSSLKPVQRFTAHSDDPALEYRSPLQPKLSQSSPTALNSFKIAPSTSSHQQSNNSNISIISPTQRKNSEGGFRNSGFNNSGFSTQNSTFRNSCCNSSMEGPNNGDFSQSNILPPKSSFQGDFENSGFGNSSRNSFNKNNGNNDDFSQPNIVSPPKSSFQGGFENSGFGNSFNANNGGGSRNFDNRSNFSSFRNDGEHRNRNSFDSRSDSHGNSDYRSKSHNNNTNSDNYRGAGYRNNFERQRNEDKDNGFSNSGFKSSRSSADRDNYRNSNNRFNDSRDRRSFQHNDNNRSHQNNDRGGGGRTYSNYDRRSGYNNSNNQRSNYNNERRGGYNDDRRDFRGGRDRLGDYQRIDPRSERIDPRSGWVKPPMAQLPPVQQMVLTPDGFKSIRPPSMAPPMSSQQYVSPPPIPMWNSAFPPPANSMAYPTFTNNSSSLSIGSGADPSLDYLKRRNAMDLEEETAHQAECRKKMRQSVRPLSPDDMDIENPSSHEQSSKGRIQQNMPANFSYYEPPPNNASMNNRYQNPPQQDSAERKMDSPPQITDRLDGFAAIDEIGRLAFVGNEEADQEDVDLRDPALLAQYQQQRGSQLNDSRRADESNPTNNGETRFSGTEAIDEIFYLTQQYTN